MNKKYILKNRRRFYIFVIAMTIIISCLFMATAVNGADNRPAFTSITVEKGDTLWNLAREYSNGGDVRNYIHEIEKANGLSDGVIYEGDILKMPV